ncbi:MAG: GNAT family N-acetyltransferase [Stellaceae bacterium]
MSDRMPDLALEWQGFAQFSPPELYALLRFRQAIFVVEQASAYPDLDGLDANARHLLLRADGELGGCLRLVLSPLLRIGRVAVAPALRGRGLGRRLMDEALRRCHVDHAGQPVVLTAQAHLERFYASFGFVTTSAPYDDFGVSHIDMQLPPP